AVIKSELSVVRGRCRRQMVNQTTRDVCIFISSTFNTSDQEGRKVVVKRLSRKIRNRSVSAKKLADRHFLPVPAAQELKRLIVFSTGDIINGKPLVTRIHVRGECGLNLVSKRHMSSPGP